MLAQSIALHLGLSSCILCHPLQFSSVLSCVPTDMPVFKLSKAFGVAFVTLARAPPTLHAMLHAAVQIEASHLELSECEKRGFVNSGGVPAGGPQKIFRVFAPLK